MAQNSDYTLDNQSGMGLRAEINQTLGDIISSNSGVTAPTGARLEVGMLWYNTSTGNVSGVAANNLAFCSAVTGTGAARTGTWSQLGSVDPSMITDPRGLSISSFNPGTNTYNAANII